MDGVLWGKHEGDGKQLTPGQSMASGFSAACLGPTVTNPFDVVKVGLTLLEPKAPVVGHAPNQCRSWSRRPGLACVLCSDKIKGLR